MPYLPWKDDFTSEKLAQYLSNSPRFAICKDRPAVCQKNAIFLIDQELPANEDLKSDNFSWRNNGTKTSNITLKDTTYLLLRTYFVHAKYKDFKRRIYSLSKSDGTPGQYVMLCYRFEETEDSVSLQESRMQPSTLKAIKKKSKSGKSYRDVYVEARQEAGGLSASKVSSRRSINQVQKLKERSIQHQSSNYTARPGQKDELYSVILKCIEDSTHSHRFLRFVQGVPQPLAFLADDHQLLDLE